MRASRLLSILSDLDAHGLVTAAELSRKCEVSIRTIYRDIEALSAAGIPVYSERGSDGGYRMVDGYRMQLNALSPREADTLFMLGLSGPASALGLGAAMVAAQNKLLSAMPPHLRASAEQMRARFHLDAPAWFAQGEQPELLPIVAKAVWTQTAIRIRYQSWRSEKQRVVEPLGLVIKSGAWYMVANINGGACTYRISRLLELTELELRFERPAKFDLAAYWSDATKRLEEDLHRNQAIIRLSPTGLQMMEMLTSPFVVAATKIEEKPDSAGWHQACMPVGSIRQACSELLQFGAELEVLEPPELRDRMAKISTGMSKIYTDEKASSFNSCN
jgi:predicted DNA-binding transcriptional regulator YafY